MPTYNVHLYREMRLFFPGIEADTPEQAAKLVAERAADEAEYTDDCEGATTSALVDLVGDEDFSETVAIDLHHDAQIIKAQAHLLDLLRRGKATISDGDFEYMSIMAPSMPSMTPSRIGLPYATQYSTHP